MKLRNKKTGEIIIPTDYTFASYDDGIKYGHHMYYSLAELNDEWEDYEEPKEHWYIDCDGEVYNSVRLNQFDLDRMANIGNKFDTKEEAEKAAEKLKALKILNDNGFRIIDWEFDPETVADGKIWFDVGLNTQWDAEQLLEQKPEVKEALDTLFGGEE